MFAAKNLVASAKSFSRVLSPSMGLQSTKSRNFSFVSKSSSSLYLFKDPFLQNLPKNRFFSEEKPVIPDTPTPTPSEPVTDAPAAPAAPVKREIGKIIQCNFKLNTFVKERKFAEAEKLFQHMLAKPELVPNVITYTTMLNSYRKQGDLNRINEMLDEMKQKNIKANDMTYNTLIEAFGKKGELDRMLSFYDEMKSNGFKPDLKTFVIIQNSLLKRNDAENQRRVLTDMKKLNVPPNDKCYNYLLESWSRRDEIEPLMATFNEMKKTGLQPDENTFNSLISAHYRAGNLNELIKKDGFFDKMKLLYVKPMAESFNQLMELLQKKGDLDAVIAAYKDIRLRKSKPDARTFHIMVDVLNQKDAPAEDFAPLVEDAKIFDVKMDIPTYDLFLKAFADRGDSANMLKTFEQIRATPRMKLAVSTFNHLITGFGRAGDMAKALEMVDEMKLKSCKPNSQTYINLIDASSRNNRLELIESLIKEMRDTYKLTPDANVYSSALAAMSKGAQWQKAATIFRNTKNEGLATKNSLKSFFNSTEESSIPENSRDAFSKLKEKLNAASPLSADEVNEVEEFFSKL